MNRLLNYKLILTGIVIGATAGYVYYYFVGCASGTCAITSNPVNSTVYGAMMGALLFSGFKKETTDKKNRKMNNTKIIIDVRTPAEFMGGHVAGSMNIPLNEIPQRLEEIRQLQKPVVLCCASGNRSAQAMLLLRETGISCENGGSWMDVNYSLNNN